MVKMNEKRARKETRATTQIMQQNDGIQKLLDDVLSYGDLLLIANKGIGKTNSLMVLAQRFRDLENTKVIIFEDFPKFALEFDRVPYFMVHDSDVEESSHVVDCEDYFLRHERDYCVNRGSEIEEFLEKQRLHFHHGNQRY
jgi:hypothetical protein